MPIDLQPLWDFNQPQLSEQRFRAALASAQSDDALILWTQIARTHGLRHDFEGARSILASVEPHLAGAGAEPRARFALEMGRTFASAAHSAPSQTPEARERARAEYLEAFEIAKASGLDALAVDALHMLAFVDTAPQDQLEWAKEALAIARASTQPAAQRWEASLQNNIGYALHRMGRYDEALAAFRAALAIRERGADAWATHIARWMVAWTLRAMSRIDEALNIQHALERDRDPSGQPDAKVLEELAILRREKASRSDR